ncbi:MAG: MFS transporter [Candidatus Thorarchaeota archaeon]
MKLIQSSDERSEVDLDDEPDLLAGQKPIENDDTFEERKGLRESIKSVFSWRNYSVYLTTAWIYTAFSYLGLFFNLYFLELFPGDYVVLGAVLSLTSIVASIARLGGGYVGDVVNRKHLSVVSMFMLAIYNLILGIFIEFTWILIALLFLSTMEIFKGGSSAFIMDNIPKEHSGVGLSLFQVGKVLGIVTLGAFVILTLILEFATSLRLMFLIGGVFLIGVTIVRFTLLEGKAPETKREGISLPRAFIQDNKRAAGLLLKTVPGLLAVVVIDSISDGLFRFGSYIYINEVVGIEIPGIIIMSLITIIVSVPLLLGAGRLSDRYSVKKLAFVVYSVVPISAILLVISPILPYWAPNSIILGADSLVEGLGAIFSTPFLAILMKSVNDSIWFLLLLIIIQKNLPRKDTSKILSVFWFIVFMTASVGPYVGGLVFEFFYQGNLFILVLVLNLLILGWIAKQGLIRDNELSETVNNG